MSDQEFTIKREFDAPRDLVWKAWTDCAYFSQWWGPTEFTTSHCTIDARPGGQPIVSWRAVVRERAGRTERVVEGHVEVRWSHGRFSGPPEAKVYLDSPHAEVPGYFPLV